MKSPVGPAGPALLKRQAGLRRAAAAPRYVTARLLALHFTARSRAAAQPAFTPNGGGIVVATVTAPLHSPWSYLALAWLRRPRAPEDTGSGMLMRVPCCRRQTAAVQR